MKLFLRFSFRMDLFSCMIVGPQGTPYADGLFFFDIRLRDDYPNRPPHAFFKSMSKSLNPNLYEDGMVCLSLLGTWDGKVSPKFVRILFRLIKKKFCSGSGTLVANVNTFASFCFDTK